MSIPVDIANAIEVGKSLELQKAKEKAEAELENSLQEEVIW